MTTNAELSSLVPGDNVYSMALHVTYRYKSQVPDLSQRRAEGIKVRKKYPAKIPVSSVYSARLDCASCEDSEVHGHGKSVYRKL